MLPHIAACLSGVASLIAWLRLVHFWHVLFNFLVCGPPLHALRAELFAMRSLARHCIRGHLVRVAMCSPLCGVSARMRSLCNFRLLLTRVLFDVVACSAPPRAMYGVCVDLSFASWLRPCAIAFISTLVRPTKLAPPPPPQVHPMARGGWRFGFKRASHQHGIPRHRGCGIPWELTTLSLCAQIRRVGIQLVLWIGKTTSGKS